ncbi:chorismate mutase [Kitasatospora purpeofusca]|uniref:chorismate mutase n=1 Tax=Kitasatospora purpeofusca TaxID=67352 RepID=UPI002E125B34|nr:chorismate mutase [Kitasatospora purpeofusca]WSR40561.1 chorismate mutase [Kitasatospora purpeofusca]
MTDHPTTPDAGLPEGVDAAVRAELTSLRESIDNIDAAVVHMLAERFKATQRVGRLKAEHKLPPADPARERAQIKRLRELAAGAHLDPVFAEKFLNFIIAEVIRHHEAIASKPLTSGAISQPED